MHVVRGSAGINSETRPPGCECLPHRRQSFVELCTPSQELVHRVIGSAIQSRSDATQATSPRFLTTRVAYETLSGASYYDVLRRFQYETNHLTGIYARCFQNRWDAQTLV
ncbi:hypothetical protein M2163_000394 [Streptomyces sp. SAI-135]|nr:hypothetical protein [Streptomyces sp. SAI-090]MDH6573984.1 hypothetical protein [Streptomyces sp. SAI-117]MDH6581280.1 hypothetical protein [Streptomyces sp. SAI-133]MDH6613286.1 hypothetical protein [Streptomyces sp. SAI-135]